MDGLLKVVFLQEIPFKINVCPLQQGLFHGIYKLAVMGLGFAGSFHFPQPDPKLASDPSKYTGPGNIVVA